MLPIVTKYVKVYPAHIYSKDKSKIYDISSRVATLTLHLLARMFFYDSERTFSISLFLKNRLKNIIGIIADETLVKYNGFYEILLINYKKLYHFIVGHF